MCVGEYVCMYVCTKSGVCICMCIGAYVRMYVCMHICMYVCMCESCALVQGGEDP